MPGPEANTVNVAKMCNAFAANGLDVTLAAAPGAPAPMLTRAIKDHYGLKEQIAVRPLPRIAARPLLSAIVGVSAARRAGATFIYTRTPHVALAACWAGLPSALEIHTDLSSFSPLARAATFGAARNANLRALVAISQALGVRLQAQLPEARAPILVAHDGADPCAAPSDRVGERLTIGFAGRPYPGKGLELILRLAPLCPDAQFEIAGATRQEAELLARCAPTPNVRFLGSIPHAEVASAIASWDIVLAPYQRQVTVADGRTDVAQWMSPLKVFEYMAAGKPILASDIPVLREVLTHDETALLLPPEDPAAWAAAIERLRAAPALRKRFGRRARAVFMSRHTWRARAGRIIEFCLGQTSQVSSPLT